jgi:hypothetical protein
MKAEEALSITKQKAPTLENVLANIKTQAENGFNNYWLMGVFINPELMQALLSLGYSIRQHTDAFNGMKGLNISW